MENGGRFKTRFNELIVEIAETNIILKSFAEDVSDAVQTDAKRHFEIGGL